MASMPMQSLGMTVAAGGAAVATASTAVALAVSHDSASSRRVTVYAATSLTQVLPTIDGRATYSFAGSNKLRLQIDRGGRAEVFLAAEPGEAQALYREGRCERPVSFATNRLVLIVPRGDPAHVGSVAGLARGGLKVSVGNPGVPVGAYARRALARLKLSRALDANVVSQQANVGQVLSQVAFGAADAGFVYVTDARSERDRVRALAIPAGAQPAISYEGCVVKRAGARTQPARALLGTLRARRGRTALER